MAFVAVSYRYNLGSISPLLPPRTDLDLEMSRPARSVAELQKLVEKDIATLKDELKKLDSEHKLACQYERQELRSVEDSLTGRIDKDVRDTRENLGKKIEERHEKANSAIDELRKDLDKRSLNRFRTGLAIVGALAALGFFGVDRLVGSEVHAAVGSDVKAELQGKLDEASSLLEDIRAAKNTAIGNPLIVLQTDYGDSTYYMGRLKGVIYDLCPTARIEVITENIEDFDLIHAAWTLARASKYYPEGTIFVSITNPGGISRNPTVLETVEGKIYIGHDNGCFDLVVEQQQFKRSFLIDNREFALHRYRDLFGGIDLFGPIAARLSGGMPIEDIGNPIDTYTPKLNITASSQDGAAVVGSVMDVDAYGNVTTNITEGQLLAASIRAGVSTSIAVERQGNELRQGTVPFKETYGDVNPGMPVALAYEGFLQLAVNEGNYSAADDANSTTPIKRGDFVKITRTP